jgi:hypothetical protein
MHVKYPEYMPRAMAYLPAIEFCNNICTLSVEDPDEVDKHVFPNAQLKLVHEIHDEKRKKVEPKLGKR